MHATRLKGGPAHVCTMSPVYEQVMLPAILVRDCESLCKSPWIAQLESCGFRIVQEKELRVSPVLGQSPPRLIVVAAPPQRPEDGLRVAVEMRQLAPGLPVILLVEKSSEEIAVRALRAGITDYFHMPAELPEFLQAVCQIASGASDHSAGAACISESPFVGVSTVMQGVESTLARIAPSNSNVLITGETGTGKELAASAIHRLSSRSERPLVCVNCAAIPDTLVESELFGYERGAFTGALARKSGWLQTADQGTVFLDEVGDLSLFAQAKLLRVLENKQFHPLGSKAGLSVNLRFIAATNRNLEEMARNGSFRHDLYYRLNIARVHIPPLRERREDIPVLLRHYIREYSRSSGPHPPEFTQEAWDCLLAYDWPGNVRELKNLVEAMHLNQANGSIRLTDLPSGLQQSVSAALPDSVEEREQVLAALLCTRWNKSKAAEKLRWSRMTLYRKIAKYRLVPPA